MSYSRENSNGLHCPAHSLGVKHSGNESTVAPAVISFDNTKAGLQKVDKAKTEAIITEISQGSSFYINEQRKAAQRARRIETLLEKSRVFESSVLANPAVFKAHAQRVDALEAELEASRHLGRVFVHMDMDMFYAAVEEKKKPQLATVPLGVGSGAMLSTTNYLARQYGVRAGMPGFIGLKLCPALVIVPCDFDSYKKEAKIVRMVAARYDPDYASLGLDELTMDLTPYLQMHFPEELQTPAGRYAAAARVMQKCRAAVHDATQLTCSAGIAPSATLAKIASNYEKPNGQHTLALATREDIVDFTRSLNVRQVPGIGKSTEAILAGLGIAKMGDVYDERYRLCYLLTPKTFRFLFSASIGIFFFFETRDETKATTAAGDAGEGEDGSPRKSVGQERTFWNLKSRLELQELAHRNLRDAHDTVVKEGLLCSQVVIKLKHRSFHVKQYSKNIEADPTQDMEVLQRAVDALLLPLADAYADYRLLGVRLEKLISKEHFDKQQQQRQQQQGKRQRSLGDCFAAKRNTTDTGNSCEHGVHGRRKRRKKEYLESDIIVVRSVSSQTQEIDIMSISSSASDSGRDSDCSDRRSRSASSMHEDGGDDDGDDDDVIIIE